MDETAFSGTGYHMRLPVSVKDANRDRVLLVLDRLLAVDKSCCGCPQCVDAIAAAALNCVPAHYYVDEKWEKQVGSPWVLIEAAVLGALEDRPKRSCCCNRT